MAAACCAEADIAEGERGEPAAVNANWLFLGIEYSASAKSAALFNTISFGNFSFVYHELPGLITTIYNVGMHIIELSPMNV